MYLAFTICCPRHSWTTGYGYYLSIGCTHSPNSSYFNHTHTNYQPIHNPTNKFSFLSQSSCSQNLTISPSIVVSQPLAQALNLEDCMPKACAKQSKKLQIAKLLALPPSLSINQHKYSSKLHMANAHIVQEAVPQALLLAIHGLDNNFSSAQLASQEQSYINQKASPCFIEGSHIIPSNIFPSVKAINFDGLPILEGTPIAHIQTIMVGIINVTDINNPVSYKDNEDAKFCRRLQTQRLKVPSLPTSFCVNSNDKMKIKKVDDETSSASIPPRFCDKACKCSACIQDWPQGCGPQ